MTKYKYELCIYITNPVDKEMISKYQQKIESNKFQDSGFDIFMPNDGSHYLYDTKDGARFLGLGLKCCMLKKGVPCGYYLYPRSSISKTKMRLANSVGIIDAGYRGHIMAMFDVIGTTNTNYEGKAYERYIQICSPGLIPMTVEIVDNIEDLGEKTERGQSGFGSTGK